MSPNHEADDEPEREEPEAESDDHDDDAPIGGASVGAEN
jgi:hypothetical protein